MCNQSAGTWPSSFAPGWLMAWHEAEPDKGYDAKAAEWREKLPDEVNSNEQDD